MRAGDDHVGGPLLFDQPGRFADRPGGGDQVVEHQDGFAFDIADDVAGDDFGAALAAFVDDRQVAAEHVGVHVGGFDIADVGADQHDLAELIADRLDVLDEDRHGEHVVDGDVEKALDLGGVQIERQHAIGPRGGDQVRHELGGDGRAAFILAVLAGIAEVGDHRRDALGRGAAQAVDVDQQLHQVGVDGVMGRLDHETVAAAHILFELDDDLAVGKHLRVALTEGDVEVETSPCGPDRGGCRGSGTSLRPDRATPARRRP